MEDVDAEYHQLRREARAYRILAGGLGIPRMLWYGAEHGYNLMALQLLGPSLEDLFDFCNRRFPLRIVLMLADQMISRLEYIHSNSLIQRDVKPENFVMGLGKQSKQVFLIDFGLAKYFEDPKTGLHIPYREHRGITGTTCYASRGTHLGIEQSRRDDMESLGYTIVYLYRGSLPWQSQKDRHRERRHQLVEEKKMTTTVEGLCRGLPKEFAQYLNYVTRLAFDGKPDYVYLRGLFHGLLTREGFENDGVFDWNVGLSRHCA